MPIGRTPDCDFHVHPRFPTCVHIDMILRYGNFCVVAFAVGDCTANGQGHGLS